MEDLIVRGSSGREKDDGRAREGDSPKTNRGICVVVQQTGQWLGGNIYYYKVLLRALKKPVAVAIDSKHLIYMPW